MEYCCHCGGILKAKKGERTMTLVRRLRASEDTCATACKLLFGSVPREIQNVLNETYICAKCYVALGQLRRAQKRWNDLAGRDSVFKGMKQVTNVIPSDCSSSTSSQRKGQKIKVCS